MCTWSLLEAGPRRLDAAWAGGTNALHGAAMTTNQTTKDTAQDTGKTEDKGTGEDDSQSQGLEWRDVGTAVSVFALFGIFLSGIAFTYTMAFYERLGVTVGDVGYS